MIPRSLRTARISSTRALRRDLAILAAAATGSLCFGTWIHAQHHAPVSVAEACAQPDIPSDGAELSARAPRPEPDAPTPQPDAGAQPLHYGEHLAFVLELDRPYVVLATEVEASWNGGELELREVDTVVRDVDLDALPEALQAKPGSRMTLYGTDDDGEAVALGPATIGQPLLLARASGELGLERPLDTWRLFEQLEREGKLPSDVEARATASIWAEGQRLLVAPLETEVVETPRWARDARLPEPTFYREVAADPRPRATLETFFATEEQGLHVITEYAAEGYGNLADALRTRRWVDDAGRTGLMTTFIDSDHLGPCGDFGWSFAVAARVQGDGLDRPRPIPTWHSEGPALVADLNLDGRPDLLMEPRILDGDTVLIAGGDEGFTVSRTLSEMPFFGCRC